MRETKGDSRESPVMRTSVSENPTLGATCKIALWFVALSLLSVQNEAVTGVSQGGTRLRCPRNTAASVRLDALGTCLLSLSESAISRERSEASVRSRAGGAAIRGVPAAGGG